MRTCLQYRLPAWQAKVFKECAKKYGVSFSTLSRFAINYILLKYKGEINLKVVDEIEFKARKRFS